MGAYTLLQDLTVTTNSTSVVLNNFGTITKDDFIKIVITNTSSNAAIAIYPNGQTTDSHYHVQGLFGNGSSVSAFRVNVNSMQIGGDGANLFIYLKLSQNDRVNIFSQTNEPGGTTLQTGFLYTTSSGVTFANGITSLNVTARANQLTTGSRIQIYRLDAEKVADITVASNTTQVDISSLSIDKDSEYLLVAESSNTVGNGGSGIYINDDTTDTNYFSQRIQGEGSSAFAFRENYPRLINIGQNNRSLTYSHIKLSNIGAATIQNYGMGIIGTSSVYILNNFISTTSESVTSITKINIINGNTNGIAAGSRFTLYKLYE